MKTAPSLTLVAVGGALTNFAAPPVLLVAVVAVLVYRAFAFWLPTVPGAIAYIQLRRRVAGWAAGAARSAVSSASSPRVRAA